MKKLKVLTMLGTRPEIIRLSEVIKACDAYFSHVLVHTGQNYDYTLNEIFFRDLALRAPDRFLNVAGGSLGETIGAIIRESFRVCEEAKPDAFLVLGDTNSALGAIAAKRLKVPVFHMEAGNRCFDENVPEEINRRIIDHIADVNLAYTENSRRYLLQEGLPRDRVFVTGSPMAEVIAAHRGSIDASTVLDRMSLVPDRYVVVSLHREENLDIGKKRRSLVDALDAVGRELGMPIIFSTHPRTAKKIAAEGIRFGPLVRAVEPLGFLDYVRLQEQSFCVLSDSGTLSEESAVLGFSGVLIRTSTERPEALDAGTVLVAGVTETGILQSIELARALKRDGRRLPPPTDYAGTGVSTKVVRIIQSWVPIVRERTWGISD